MRQSTKGVVFDFIENVQAKPRLYWTANCVRLSQLDESPRASPRAAAFRDAAAGVICLAPSRGTMAAIYRLRTGRLGADGRLLAIVDDILLGAVDATDAVAAARDYPVDLYLEAGGYGWITDEEDRVIWTLTVEEGKP